MVSPGHSQGNKVRGRLRALRLFCRHREEKICSGSTATGGSSPGTLNPRHMIGGLTAGHRTDLEKLVFRANTVGSDPGGHWQ
jgi:hypothetical protein